MSVQNNIKEAWELYQDHPDALNDWEGNFLTDNYGRFEQFTDRTKFSSKQEDTIEKILEKLRKA